MTKRQLLEGQSWQGQMGLIRLEADVVLDLETESVLEEMIFRES